MVQSVASAIHPNPGCGVQRADHKWGRAAKGDVLQQMIDKDLFFCLKVQEDRRILLFSNRIS